MNFCPVVPEICRGQVHVPWKERKEEKNNKNNNNNKQSKKNKSPNSLCKFFTSSLNSNVTPDFSLFIYSVPSNPYLEILPLH
jgi:hypothetical protein